MLSVITGGLHCITARDLEQIGDLIVRIILDRLHCRVFLPGRAFVSKTFALRLLKKRPNRSNLKGNVNQVKRIT